MRLHIARLVLATTSAVVISFVVPLCLLVRVLAEDRAMAAADEQARNTALLVSTLTDSGRLRALLDAGNQRGPALTTVLQPDDTTLGAPVPDLADDPAVRRARTGVASKTTNDGGGQVVLPVVLPRGTDVVVARVTPSQLHVGVTRAWLSIVGLGLVLLAVALLVADRISRRISRPLVDLAATADRLRAGELDARARPEGPPEARDLARALNGLAERITELLVAERSAVGDLSHRLRTPVTALRLDAESVPDRALAERLQEHIAVLQREIDAIVHDARRPVLENMPSTSDLSAIVTARVAFWKPLAEDQGRELGFEVASEPLRVGLPEADLRDVVDVLIDNVFAHTAEGTPFRIEVRAEGDEAVLVVSDRGAGTQAASPPGAAPGSTGLGLAIVRRSVAAAGGRTMMRSGAEGTRVEARFPLRDGR